MFRSLLTVVSRLDLLGTILNTDPLPYFLRIVLPRTIYVCSVVGGITAFIQGMSSPPPINTVHNQPQIVLVWIATSLLLSRCSVSGTINNHTSLMKSPCFLFPSPLCDFFVSVVSFITPLISSLDIRNLSILVNTQ